MNHELWRYELRRIGWLALVGPPLALMGIGLLALVANQLGHADQVARILTTSLDVLPLVGGVAAATAVSADEALELQLSLPTTFRTTIIRRLALSLGWTGLLAFASTLALSVNGSLRGANSLLGDQLTWLAPLLWLVGVATALSLGLRVGIRAGAEGFVRRHPLARTALAVRALAAAASDAVGLQPLRAACFGCCAAGAGLLVAWSS